MVPTSMRQGSNAFSLSSPELTSGQVSNALDQTLHRFDLVGSDVADQAGTNPFDLSRFRTGKKDVHSSLLLRILKSLPLEARMFFLIKLGIFESNDLTNLEVSLQALRLAWKIIQLDSELSRN
jgi:hypothetical protein